MVDQISTIEEVETIQLKDLSLEYLGKEVYVNVIVLDKSDKRLMQSQRTFVCANAVCGRTYFRSQRKCDHCYQEKFNEEFEYKDLFSAIVMPSEDTVSGDKDISKEVVFYGHLVERHHEVLMGNKYRLHATVMSKKLKAKSVIEEFYLECHGFDHIQEGLDQVEINWTDEEKLTQLSEDPNCLERIRKAVFGTDLYGTELLEEAAVLQMISAPKRIIRKVLKDRGNVNVLICGSPGKGKSQILKRVSSFFPKSRYTSCSNASSIGLTATVQKDERIGDWVAKPGVVALCHKGGIACIDELDKIPKDDLGKLNTQMDSLHIYLDKASVHMKLFADVSILAAMNPKDKVFNMMDLMHEQISVNKDFLDRFDLVFAIDKFVDSDKSGDIMSKMLSIYTEESATDSEESNEKELVMKYIARARTKQVYLDAGSIQAIKTEFNKITGQGTEGAYFSPRLLEKLIRLCCAYTRLRLSEQIDFIDIKNASNILFESLKSMDFVSEDHRNGLIVNLEDLEGITPKDMRDRYRAIMKVVESLGGKRELVSIEEISLNLNMDAIDFEKAMQKLILRGDLFEPRRGFVKVY